MEAVGRTVHTVVLPGCGWRTLLGMAGVGPHFLDDLDGITILFMENNGSGYDLQGCWHSCNGRLASCDVTSGVRTLARTCFVTDGFFLSPIFRRHLSISPELRKGPSVLKHKTYINEFFMILFYFVVIPFWISICGVAIKCPPYNYKSSHRSLKWACSW